MEKWQGPTYVLIEAADCYELPVAVAGTVKELASLSGLTMGQIYKSLRRGTPTRFRDREYIVIRCEW